MILISITYPKLNVLPRCAEFCTSVGIIGFYGFAKAIGEFGATLMLAGNISGKTNKMSFSIYSAFMEGNNELAQMLVLILNNFITGYFSNWKIRR